MIGFVIPAYKAPEDLDRCEQCITRQDVHYKIFVHDNTIDNRYFTVAVNKGIKNFLGDADYICVINQDCFLEDDAIKNMVRLMRSNPDIGIVSACHRTSEDTDICYDTGGYAILPGGISISFPRLELKDAPLLWASAACWLLRPEMIEEIGLLDENLVHFCSDVDYCYTARARGWEVWRCAKAVGIHKPNSLNLSPEMIKRRNLDTEYFVKKWCGGLFHELSFTWTEEPLKQEIAVYKKGIKIGMRKEKVCPITHDGT